MASKLRALALLPEKAGERILKSLKLTTGLRAR